MNKIFKMLTKPSKPVRMKIKHQEDLSEFDSLAGVVRFCQERGISLKDTRIFIDSDDLDYYSSGKSVFFEWSALEKEESWQRRLEVYNGKLEEYNKWEMENKENIELYKQLKKEKELKERNKRMEKIGKTTQGLKKKIDRQRA